jgi:hypothetical protein
MDAVTEILNRGMSKMRSLFLSFQRDIEHASAIDNSVLQNFVIPPFPIDWELGALRIMSAVDLTAHLRYINWHAVRFRGVKHQRDSSYERSSESEQDGKAKAELSHRNRSSTSKPPPHYVFQTITMDAIVPSYNLVAGDSTTSSTGKPKKNSGSGKSKSSKGDKKSRAGKGLNKRRKH